MKPSSSAQEIQDYLDGLNRLRQSWSGSRESAAARQLGLTNYFQWFRERDIAIFEDPHDRLWKLKEGT